MKTLAITLPRTGSTRLFFVLKKFFKKSMMEPFNHDSAANYNNIKVYPDNFLEDNLFVKTIISQVCLKTKLSNSEFYIKIASDFDNVILLDRINYDDHLISITNLLSKIGKKIEYNRERGIYLHQHQEQFDVHQPWHVDELSSEDFEMIEKYNIPQSLKKEKEDLNIISNALEVPITYYEDLYGDDRSKSLQIINGWNLGLDSEYINSKLHPKNKYLKPSRSII